MTGDVGDSFVLIRGQLFFVFLCVLCGLSFVFFRAILSHKQFMGSDKNKPGDLVQGTLDMLVLKGLERGPMHGYGVAEWIHESSADVLRVEEGALYPALHRLELKGLLKAEWGTSENNRRAKFYALTAAGRKYLTVETEHWGRMTSAIARVLQRA